MTVHDFRRSLEKSHAMEDAPLWEAVYRKAFPSFAGMVSVREDGWAQRAGIDRVITLKGAKTLTVDEKVREKDWNDILLERWSDEKRKIPGWVQKDLACDYIAYAFIPSQRCYLLPFQELRRAWRQQGRRWIQTYKKISAQNNSYVTVSVAVPIPVLMTAISDAMLINWPRAA